MKAIVFSHYGSPDRLHLEDVVEPTPKDDEVLVRVQASSINSWDWEFLRGTPFINRLMHGLFKPRPDSRILGSDIAGTVEAVGRNASRFRPGDEVFGDLWDRWGGFAEFACAPEAALEQKPANVTFEEAAAVPQAGVLALQALRIGGAVTSGQKVLINGAGGGVGTFAIQLAKLSGAVVTGVDASRKLDVVLSAGADQIIDYAREDFTATGKQYDLVVDCQNFRSAADNRRALLPGGVYAMVGGSIPRVYELWFFRLLESLRRDSKKLRLVVAGPNKGLGDLKELIEAGQLTPIIDRTYRLSEVPEAMRYFGEGRHRGKIAISVNSGSPGY